MELEMMTDEAGIGASRMSSSTSTGLGGQKGTICMTLSQRIGRSGAL